MIVGSDEVVWTELTCQKGRGGSRGRRRRFPDWPGDGGVGGGFRPSLELE